MISILLPSVISFIAGLVDAIAGGGGVITLPTLLFLGLPVDIALGTSKLISSSGTTLAATNFIKRGKFSTFVIKYNVICTALGASLGALCVSYLVTDRIKPFISFLIICIALYFYFKPKLGLITKDIRPSKIKIFCSAIGAGALGFYDGIFGPGTGAFLSFMFIRLLGQDFVLANGNTKILNLTSNLVALCIFILHGKIAWEIGIPMALANMLGGLVGSNIAIKKGSSWVRWIFIVMALMVGIRQLFA